MDFSFSEEQQALRELARQILASASDAGKDVWGELGRSGVLGVVVPEEHGGGGGGLIEACVVLEEVGRAGVPLSAHSALVLGALPLARFGSEEQQAELLPGLATGEGLITTALPETALDDPDLTPVEAKTGSAGWRVDGTISFVPGADRAARLFVPASTEDGPAMFEIDPASEGVEITPQPSAGGEPLFLVALEWAESQRTLGPLEAGAEVVAWIAEHAAVGYCALQLGLVERALRLTADYVSQRVQFDRPLGTFQAVQQRAADAYIDAESIRATLWPAAWRLSRGEQASEAVAVAKFFAAEAGQRVIAAAQHLHGGIGVDMDYPLHRYTFWAKQVELALGGANRQLARLGKAMAAAKPEDCP